MFRGPAWRAGATGAISLGSGGVGSARALGVISIASVVGSSVAVGWSRLGSSPRQAARASAKMDHAATRMTIWNLMATDTVYGRGP